MARPPPRMQDASLFGGIFPQRVDANFSAFSPRLMQQEHLSRLYHHVGSPSLPARSDLARNFMPEPINMVDGQPYGNVEREHSLAGSGGNYISVSSGMLASVDKPEGLVDDSQRFVNGRSYVSTVQNSSPRVLDWAGNERSGERATEVEYRVEEDADGGSSGGSQSIGSEEDEDDDEDVDGGGEGLETDHGGTRLVDNRLPSQRSDQVVSGMHSEAMEASRQELAAGLQSSEGFQEATFDRDLPPAHVATPSSTTSIGMFMSPSATMPFLGSFSSSASVGPMMVGGHDGGSTNGKPVCANSGLSTAHGYFRDGMVKEATSMEDSFAKENESLKTCDDPDPHRSSPIIAEAVPIASATAQCYNSLIQATTVNPCSEQGNRIAAAISHRSRKGHESMEMPLRAALTDPLTGALMDDATILLCGHSFGSESLQRVLENNACISCGSAARREDMAPNHALRLVVQAYKREERRWKENASRAARRRRERLEQERRNLGELVPYDPSRHKNMQFPYKVNDRVLIKGNKRTPERFVGRNAVITTQCLNGWYVVRTLDNGESVKLQYRSLMKTEEQQPSKELEPNSTATPNWL